jgi:hypothetical protein
MDGILPVDVQTSKLEVPEIAALEGVATARVLAQYLGWFFSQ